MKKNKLQLITVILGIGLLVWETGWITALGVYFLIWANNFDFVQKG